MSVLVPLFVLAPLVLVPLGYRLLEVVAPGSRPPALVLRLVLPAGASLAVAFWLPASLIAAVLSLPWVAVTGATAAAAGLRWLHDPDRFHPDVRHATDAAVAFLAVGAVFALTDRLGIQPFGFSATIILLTAVHFHFAGFVLPLAGALAWTRGPSRWLELALGAVIVGIPITALGFFGLPLANWVGAVLTAAGGFGIGIATLVEARTLQPRAAVVLSVVGGASLLIAMPLAAIYATGTLTGNAWLAVDTMARVHGGLNALGFALPAIFAWTFDRRARSPIEPAPAAPPARDPRRLGLGAAGIIAGYACVVGLISANAGAGDLGPPVLMPRPLILAGLLMVPAGLAAIGAWHQSRPLLVIAGVMCLFQSFISFAGVTLPFLVPAGLLIALGVSGDKTAPRRVALGSLAVIALWMGAWIATFALTETVCWVARAGATGALVYSQIPVTDTYTMGLDEVAQGCDGGVVSPTGVALAIILAIGAIAVAELSSRPSEGSSPVGGGTGAGGPTGPLDVMRFNATPFVLGPLVAIVAALLALAPLPTVIRIAFALAAIVAAALSASAIVAVVWVFGIGARRRWTWVAEAAGSPSRWLNVTTGFDDSTLALRDLLPGTEGVAVDVFDPAIEHEAALLRARRRYPPVAPSSSPGALHPASTAGTYDTAFLLMSAHEAHDRRSFVAAVADALTPSGRIVLVEHLRDLPNRLAFGPGADHFQARSTWLAAAAGAGFVPTAERRLTPYVRGFVFERAQP